ncbi:short chain enoyl-CoA hydratase /3-hydroxyacyl-CoA dehydrogenase [Neorhodopirellula lusitana]|uniref:enoyl-CoA hydratase n=1 Tax=Neorhodopirellula lusitana TaxID=445327 RepID=A0ABY1QNS3_9BACT|nr:3-hydroxyacyl-CoA dehydrogenase NAD-binding domain-containing protein [Neorhodopirellula lusitana]SMP76471.1 short chain enoyl-CoA hydratase /3-hydroxyacyl-CoA dehydrogenase [Neorhodopirellula lusitana]
MNSAIYQNFTVTEDKRGVVTVSIDVPGRPLNILTRDAMEELSQIVDAIEHAAGISMVVFESGKESGFLAGADVSAISEIDSVEEATRLIVAGQSLFQRIAWLPMATVLVIDGPCLGGGLEWALACDHRIARASSHTKIGLPEIKLGLIPGWGGTQRLPRLIGTHAALDMILKGKHLSATDAFRVGLVDQAIDPEQWQTQRDHFITKVLYRKAGRSHGWLTRVKIRLSKLGLIRHAILKVARNGIASKSVHYPALASAIRSIEAGFERGPIGYQVEREEFVKLLNSTTSKRLLGLFFAREKARKFATWTDDATPVLHHSPIRRVGVIGAGAMGAGIAQLAAVRDFEVVVKEVDDTQLQSGRIRVGKLMKGLAARQNWGDAKLKSALNRVSYTTKPIEMSDCDLVIEAVVERDEVKAKVFAEMDRVTRPSAVLASNTSSLSVTRMSQATRHPERVAGLHFFNPVHRMELVEVIRCVDTDQATVARLIGFVKAMGKTPVVTADTPGFLVNRVLFPYLGEAVRMLGEGYSVKQIDGQVRKFGMPMGPLELLDQVGIDIAVHVAGSLEAVSRGTAEVVNPLSEMVRAGRLGKKTGRGFYDYRKGRKWKPMDRFNKRQEPKFASTRAGFVVDGMSAIQRRLIYPMLIEAITCHQEQVVQEAWAIDLAMVLGTGFAPHHGGPLHLVDTIGLKRVVQNSNQLCGLHGDRFTPPEQLIAMADRGETFFGPRLQLEPR